MNELGIIFSIIGVTTGVMMWLVKIFKGYLNDFDQMTNKAQEPAE